MAAEVGGGESGRPKKGKKHKRRRPKQKPRIDMTPMVDVAFLLLTFFVLTTTLTTPSTMPVVVPPKVEKEQLEESQEKVQASKVVHLLIGGNDRIFWYQASEEQLAQGNVEFNMTNFSPKGIRKTLMELREKIESQWGKNQMIVLIKVTDEARYQNFVDILDEMNILEIKKYMLVDPTKEEMQMIQDYLANMGLK
jgi:biopolymer transport protein ExbD